jgi:hypothetical protein
MSVRGGDGGTRWAVRLALARVMQVVVLTSPVVAAVGVSSLAHLAMGTARSRAERAWHLAVPSAVSTIAAD